MIRLRRLLLPVLLTLASMPVAAQSDLFSLTGNWRGVGAIVTEPGQAGREGRCRLTATPLEVGREIRLKGRCATDQGSAELSMRFVLSPDGALAGGIASSTQSGTLQFVGRLDGDTARLSSREPLDVGDLRGISVFTLTLLDPAHFKLAQWLEPQDGSAKVGMVQMQFTRAQ